MRVGEHGQDRPAEAPAQPARPQPATGLLSPGSVLQLQRAAGNRAVRTLQRRVTGDVLHNSVGEQFAAELTPDELREQVAILVKALESGKLDATNREVVEQNLTELEDYGAGHGI